MADILVAYYSRTGRTRLIAERLAKMLGADIAPLVEKKDRSGPLGFLVAILDTLLDRPAELVNFPDPSPYAMVVLGMPVWAHHAPPAVREYLKRTNLAGKTVCAFCTYDGSGSDGTFKSLNALLPVPLAETFHWKKPKESDPALKEALAKWADALRKRLSGRTEKAPGS